MSAITVDSIARIFQGREPKRLARLAQVHPRTAARWQAGESAPGADDLVRMMAADAEIFAEIARLAGRAGAGQRAVAAEHIRLALHAMEQSL